MSSVLILPTPNAALHTTGTGVYLKVSVKMPRNSISYLSAVSFQHCGSTQEPNTESKEIQLPPEEMAETEECSVILTGHCWAEE